jgi:hypothetical protein
MAVSQDERWLPDQLQQRPRNAGVDPREAHGVAATIEKLGAS